MSEGRKKPGVALWATVIVVVVLVLYPLSFGPYVWLATKGYIPLRVVNIFPYQPLHAAGRAVPAFNAALNRYAAWWYPKGYWSSTRPMLMRTN